MCGCVELPINVSILAVWYPSFRSQPQGALILAYVRAQQPEKWEKVADPPAIAVATTIRAN